jgi:hypothetical protein
MGLNFKRSMSTRRFNSDDAGQIPTSSCSAILGYHYPRFEPIGSSRAVTCPDADGFQLQQWRWAR